MKHSIFVKFIAIALCALSLLAAAAGGLSIIALAERGLYEKTVEELYHEQLEEDAYWFAKQVGQNYASTNLGGCPEPMIGHLLYFNAGYYGYTIEDEQGRVLEALEVEESEDAHTCSFTVSGSYMKVLDTYGESSGSEIADGGDYEIYDVISGDGSLVYGFTYDDGERSDSFSDDNPIGMIYHDENGYAAFTSFEPGIIDFEGSTEPIYIVFFAEEGRPLYEISNSNGVGTMILNDDGLLNFSANVASAQEVPSETMPSTEPASDIHYFAYYDSELGYDVVVEYIWEVMPQYTVTMTLLPGAMTNEYAYTLAGVLSGYRDIFPWMVGAGLLIFAITAVYLCCAAGRRPGIDEVHPSGLNRMPLDLYLGVCCLAVFCLVLAGVEGGTALFREDSEVGLGFVALLGYAIALIIVAFCFAFAAQVKVKGGYWWRHMVLGWCLAQVMKFFRWLGRGLKWLRNGIRAVFNLLPVIWQWLLIAFLMVLSVVVTFLCCMVTWGFWNFFWALAFFVSLVGCVIIVCYGGYCFGTLLKGAKHMAQGNLEHKINTKYLYGAFKDFGNQLNNLAEGAKIAAERQMKSERMKTELITNVSHDIKTPLTSIINYVDLLKKPHSDADGKQYLDVLDRQSQRLKKLIDDLMEMSKASTGNLTVELAHVDAVEAVNQALGEFADKLSAVNLTPVFRHPEGPVVMRADGRLVWRVLSNLLSNAYKYALPDTRLYIDLMVLQGNAVIAIKNISREQLNVNADELMERFVRGDSSRNTEGSGLGLNIAKSLVELQHGQMHLMVDGDLFKVTLIFPMG